MTVSASAYSQMREHLRHTAFIEMDNVVTGAFYENEEIRTYFGFRLLGVDGSKVRLPEAPAIREAFGEIHITNRVMNGTYSGAQASVLYDMLNDMVIDSRIDRGDVGEHALAHQHLEQAQEGDLILYDRGYPSYPWGKLKC